MKTFNCQETHPLDQVLKSVLNCSCLIPLSVLLLFPLQLLFSFRFFFTLFSIFQLKKHYIRISSLFAKSRYRKENNMQVKAPQKILCSSYLTNKLNHFSSAKYLPGVYNSRQLNQICQGMLWQKLIIEHILPRYFGTSSQKVS